MPSQDNRIVIASAGSLKTTMIAQEALAATNRRVLITTYTNENVSQIKSYIFRLGGCLPSNVTVTSWYSFLLQDGVRPYQNRITSRPRIRTIDFNATPERYVARANASKYYLTEANDIYRDRVADFVCECNKQSGGLVLRRLERIYTHIFIDEMQDFAGFDLDFLEALLRSSLSIIAVGDPRQATFSTNNSSKNKKYKKGHILDWVCAKQKKGLFKLQERTDCYRSNQVICDFADSLFPLLPKTTSKNDTTTGHDGVFYIREGEVLDYYKKHNPVVLRHDRRTKTLGLPAFNIGAVKGRTYERVLIFPTQPMKNYVATRDLSKAGDLSKLYVAVTRAKHSATFVL
jgi:hypothetical protein